MGSSENIPNLPLISDAAVASTVTLLVGNISFKCKCQPVRVLFNDAKTEAQRQEYQSTGSAVQL